MYLPEKHLCEIGKALETDWDIALENYRREKKEVNKDKVYLAAKSYFNHRSDCPDCKVFWEKK